MPIRLLLFGIAVLFSYIGYGRELSALGQSRPLSFLENKGEVTDQYGNPRNDIDAKLETPGMTVFIGQGAIHYQWTKVVSAKTWTAGLPGSKHTFDDDVTVETYRMDVELVDANEQAVCIKEEEQTYYEYYYLPQCPDGARAGSFNRIVYKNIYPGIDWVLYCKNNELKYDFVVHAGADAGIIRLRYNGATSLRINNGELEAETPMGRITEGRPYCYRTDNREVIPSSYTLDRNVLSFNLEAGNNNYIIDPTLAWSTYYGDISSDEFESVTSDTAANVFTAGRTSSSTNIATTGAFQQTYSANADAFIVKLNAAGARIWSTYYGGSLSDHFYDCAAGPDGSCYAAGQTRNSGLASTGAHQTGFFGIEDGLLVKFNAQGQRSWATYYSGTPFTATSEYTYGRAVTVDGQGNVIFGGSTGAATGIATTGAAQTTGNVGSGFVAKFNSAGVRQWGTYLGIGHGLIEDLACDGAGNIYGCGTTYSSATGISTTGSFQPTGAGLTDGFAVKYSAAGAKLWGTFYGGTANDVFHTITADPLGNAYAAGYSWSPGLATAGAHQTSLAGNVNDGLVVKFNTNGGRTWATYFGGSQSDYILSAFFGADSKLYVSGFTISTSGIATTAATQTSMSGGSDAFVAGFTTGGSQFWGTYLGGTAGEVSHGINYSITGRIFVTGNTGSTSGIATAGSHQTSHAGLSDGFITCYNSDAAVYLLQTSSIPQSLCKGDSVLLFFGSSVSMLAGNAFTIQLSNASGSFSSPTNVGSVIAQTGGSIKVLIPASVANGNGYRIRVVSSQPAHISIDNGFDIKISTVPPKPQAAVNFPVCEGDSIKLSVGNIPGVTWSWSGPGSFTSTDQNPNITNAGTAAAGDYVVIADNNGCISKDTVAVTVNIKPAKPVALSNTPICAGAFFILGASTSTPGVSWNWIGPGSFTSTLQNPIINTSKPADSGDYIVFASLGGCSSSDTVNAIIKATKPLVTITSNPSPAKPGVLNNFNALVTNGGSTPTYQWRRNGAAQGGAINANWSVSGLHPYDKITCQVTSSDSCASPKTAISNEIVVNFPTGIDDVKPDQCALYPNPNDGKFILSLPLTPSRGGHISVEVVNVVGQVVYSLDIPLAPYKGGISISLPENVVSGVYLLRVKRGDEVKTMRFTVTR